LALTTPLRLALRIAAIALGADCGWRILGTRLT
jgi:hypothetical protein